MFKCRAKIKRGQGRHGDTIRSWVSKKPVLGLNKYIILKCYFHNYIKLVRKRFVAGIMLTIEETMVMDSVL